MNAMDSMPAIPPRGPMQMAASQDAEPDSDEGMGEGEVCVPLKALTQPDQQDQMQTPAVGDSGTMTVDYIVTRIEGDNAYVKPNSVNGTALDDGEADEPTPDSEGGPDEGDDEGDTLRSQAQAM